MSTKQVWPVMLTPFTDEGAIDYTALGKLIEWYEENGVSGLFAVCQSSEMFYMSLRERVEVAAFVKKHARVPVIASGHISVDAGDQLDEAQRIADTGVDAFVLLTNRFAGADEGSDSWLTRMEALLEKLDPALPLGFYECPQPYKRLITDDELRICAQTGRFQFMKDTCCELTRLERRANILADTPMRLYNANITTLLDSVRAGCEGFSGIMANFHPDLFVWLMRNYERYPAAAESVQAALTMCSLIERQCYPVNAKYYLQSIGLPMTTYCRTRNQSELTATFRDEVRQMALLAQAVRESLPRA